MQALWEMSMLRMFGHSELAEPAPLGPAYEGEPEGLWDANQRRTEPAPQEVRPELTTSEVGNVTDPNHPAGAAHELSNNIGQLPDEVAEMVKFLNSHGVGNDVNWRSARLAADMLERLARELAKHQESQFHPDWSMLEATRESLREHQARIAELESQREGWVLVPKKPTDEMVKAFNELPYSWAAVTFATKYKAMLAAAPKKENDK